MNLPFAGVAIGVTERFPNVVSSGFDSIRVRGESCRILKIQKVDYKRMQAELAAEKKATRLSALDPFGALQLSFGAS